MRAFQTFALTVGYQRCFGAKNRQEKKSCSGRHNNTRLSAFDNVIQYLDTLDSEQVTVRDLVGIMAEHLKDCESEAYSNINMKTKLIKHYGDEILFAWAPNQADAITLKKTATTILRDFYKQPRNLDTEAEKRRVIKAAADIIHSDIKSMASSREEYPDSTAIENHRNYIPETLRQFLEQVIHKKDASLKISVIGQALVQSTRPYTVIAPLQIGLAVQMHRTFGSRFLTDTLSHLGFCTSYTELESLNSTLRYSMESISLKRRFSSWQITLITKNLQRPSMAKTRSMGWEWLLL